MTIPHEGGVTACRMMEEPRLPQHGEEHAHVAIFEALLSWSEAIRHYMWRLRAMLEPHYIGFRN